jgi:hypothetical protein
MKVILKDTDLIMTYINVGFRNLIQNSNNEIWLSQFTLLDLTINETYTISPLVTQKIIYTYSFSEKEVLQVYSLYNDFQSNITVAEASAIIMAKNFEEKTNPDGSLKITDDELISRVNKIIASTKEE